MLARQVLYYMKNSSSPRSNIGGVIIANFSGLKKDPGLPSKHIT
jgi:hypothetical protein